MLFCCVYISHGKDSIQSPFPQEITIHKFQICVNCQVHIILHLFCFKNNKYGLPKQIFFITFCDNRVPTNKTNNWFKKKNLWWFFSSSSIFLIFIFESSKCGRNPCYQWCPWHKQELSIKSQFFPIAFPYILSFCWNFNTIWRGIFKVGVAIHNTCVSTVYSLLVFLKIPTDGSLWLEYISSKIHQLTPPNFEVLDSKIYWVKGRRAEGKAFTNANFSKQIRFLDV